jgi:hypothetical protein
LEHIFIEGEQQCGTESGRAERFHGDAGDTGGDCMIGSVSNVENELYINNEVIEDMKLDTRDGITCYPLGIRERP